MNSHLHELSRRPARHGQSPWRCGLMALCCLIIALPAWSVPPQSPKNPPRHFLFIVDTSDSMHRRAPGVRQTIATLLESDLDGRLRPGDFIGVWTYNEEVYTDRFPWQPWSPAARRAITEKILGFLSNQRHEKKPDLDKALTKAFGVVPQSPAITLVLFTDGDKRLQGTPFDDAINGAFREHRAEQQRTRMPAVAVLRAEGGRFVNYAVGLPPWPISIPLVPGEQRALSASHPIPSPEQPAPPSTVPSQLVASARENGQAVTPSENAQKRPLKPPGPEVAPEPAGLVATEPATEPLAIAPPTKPAGTEIKSTPKPETGTPVGTAASPPIARTASHSANEPGKAEPVSAPSPEVAPPDPASPKPATSAKSELPASPPPKLGVGRAVEPSRLPEVDKPLATVASAPVQLPDSSLKPEEQEPKPAVQFKPADIAPDQTPVSSRVAAKPTLPEPTAESVGVASASTPPTTIPPAEDRRAAMGPPAPPVAAHPPPPPPPSEQAATASRTEKSPPVQTAVAVAPQPFLSGHRPLVLGLLLLAVAAGLLWRIVRRTRATAPATSLITQSFDREKDEP